MSVRHEHNRVKEEPMGKDKQEVIKKAKNLHKGYGKFYIKVIGDTYYSTIQEWGGEILETWKNISEHGKRAKWVRID